ncbi:MAG: PAC2 family protein [Candidatus Omnitrophota bacterium]
MNKVKITRRPKLKNPQLIVAWPGMGDVAFRTASFLIEKLGAKEFASIPSEDFLYLSGSIVQDGILDLPAPPTNKFYYWKNTRQGKDASDLIIFISDAQPDLTYYDEYCETILSAVKNHDLKTVICFAALPVPSDHTQDSEVLYCATDRKFSEELSAHKIKKLSSGQISGMNGLFLGLAKKKGYRGFCLLGEIPIYTIQIENPKAAQALLEALNKILGLSLDTHELKEQGRLIEDQINQLVDYLKPGSQHTPSPISEEEIERIKKSLSEYSKLPQSIRAKIEELFQQSRKDITKAGELKSELDKWNIYKEYEDKFLDLFKKPGDKSN